MLKRRFYLNISISNGKVSTKLYDKWDDIDLPLIFRSLMAMSLGEPLIAAPPPTSPPPYTTNNNNTTTTTTTLAI